MSAPFKTGQVVKHKRDGRVATVKKVHFVLGKDGDNGKTSRNYTQVAVSIHPTQTVKGYVNSFWDVADTMDSAAYDTWAERRGINPENPQPADDDTPKLENPAPVPAGGEPASVNAIDANGDEGE